MGPLPGRALRGGQGPFILATGQGLPVAILLVLFIPGYALVAALFPDNKEINRIQRIALSFVDGACTSRTRQGDQNC